MTKRTHKPSQAQRLRIVGSEPHDPVATPEIIKTETGITVEAPGEVMLEPPAPKTVVKVAYKHRYQDLAKQRGFKDKASRRGNGDWLQRELQAETIGKDGRFDFERFVTILDANGVDHSRWKTEGNGWQGRFRMSGSVSLRGIVGKKGSLQLSADPTHTISVQELADGGDEDAQAFLAKWAN